MSFADRITRAPIPYDPALGAEAAARLPDTVSELATGAAGCSPYLAGLIAKEAAWLTDALAGSPEDALAAVITETAAAEEEALGATLRQQKRRLAALAGLADLGGVWTLEEVTGALTRFAETALDRALRSAIAAEIARGRLPGQDESAIPQAGGMVAFAMGKMGAYELNYSSDIDLVCLFDETRFDPDDIPQARSSFVRATRKAMGLMADITHDGYVFRTDLRLRPDPSVTPVCLSMEAAERYYESVGRAWERAAWLKARPCAGDIEAGDRFLSDIRPFVWRRHLDFAAIEDAHDMIRKIRSAKGLYDGAPLEGYDLKLASGGIREIEFFTQTRQLIAGGRDPSLRVRGSVEGLARLAAAGWVEPEVAETLTRHYRAHRETEHRLQMLRDAQTHRLPQSAEDFDRLARFSGEADTRAYRDGLRARILEVSELTEPFFSPAPQGQAKETSDDLPELELTDSMRALVDRWPSYPALRSARAVAIFNRLKPEIFARIARAAHPHEALAAFDGFLAGLPAGVQVFSLFEANPQLIDLLGDIVATAPRLARYLARNARVFDAVIGGRFFGAWPSVETLKQELRDELSHVDADDYEGRLDAARAWAKEWHFRIGLFHLRGLSDAAESGLDYADLADAVVSVLLPEVQREFARKHGDAPGRGAVVLAMGSVGAAQLTAASDLDLIVIYDADGVESSDGRRPLAAGAYYARLTQAMVTALSAAMAEGKLYEVDMRLRPSGRQGPVATALEAFRDYQRNRAWTWEHLALTRSRVIAGPAPLAEDVAAFRATLLGEGADPEKVAADVTEMRGRIAAAKPATDPWDAKAGPGGMQEIELLASAAALIAGETGNRIADHLAAAGRIGWLSGAEIATLGETYALLWSLRASARLLTDDAFDPEEIGAGGRAFLLRETGAEDLDSLRAALEEQTAAAAAIIERALENPPKRPGA